MDQTYPSQPGLLDGVNWPENYHRYPEASSSSFQVNQDHAGSHTDFIQDLLGELEAAGAISPTGSTDSGGGSELLLGGHDIDDIGSEAAILLDVLMALDQENLSLNSLDQLVHQPETLAPLPNYGTFSGGRVTTDGSDIKASLTLDPPEEPTESVQLNNCSRHAREPTEIVQLNSCSGHAREPTDAKNIFAIVVVIVATVVFRFFFV